MFTSGMGKLRWLFGPNKMIPDNFIRMSCFNAAPIQGNDENDAKDTHYQVKVNILCKNISTFEKQSVDNCNC